MSHRSSKFSGWLLIAIPILVIAGLSIWSATRPSPGQKVSNQGNRHLQTIADTHEPYNSKPPTSGPHLNNKAPWGITTTQIPDELQVHNLEDGGVIVHYDPAEATTSTIQALETIVNPYVSKGKNIILEPYAPMDSLIALTAWTRMLQLSNVDTVAIDQFIDAYVGIDHHVRGL